MSRVDGSTSSDPTGTIARYDWTWGDGSSSPDGGATAAHTFATAGTYAITLTVTNDAGCSTTTVTAGQTVFCHGSTSATTTQHIAVAKATPGNGQTPPPNPKRPVATTSAASHVTQHRAVLHGTLNPGDASATYYFEYGTSTSYSLATRKVTLSGDSAQAVTASIGSLRLGTRYHFRLVAINSTGGSDGADRTLKTVGRLKPRLTLSISPRREVLDGNDTDDQPFYFTASGRLHLPAGVSTSEGCRGHIEISVDVGTTKISHAIPVATNCGYHTHVSFWLGGENPGGIVRITAAFNGNRALKPASTSDRTIAYSERGTQDIDSRHLRHAPDKG